MNFFLRFSDYYQIEHLDLITGIGVKNAGGLVLKHLKEKTFFKARDYILEKRFNNYKNQPRGLLIAPFDGYYFRLFIDLLSAINIGEQLKIFETKNVLKEEIIPIFEKLISFDEKNLEVWLVTAMIYGLIDDAENLLTKAEKIDPLIKQNLEIKDPEVINVFKSSIKLISAYLNKSKRNDLAERILKIEKQNL